MEDLGEIHVCPSCDGRVIGYYALKRANIEETYVRKIWQDANKTSRISNKACSVCATPMTPVDSEIENRILRLDICRKCQVVWFDSGEYDRLPKRAIPPSKPASLYDDLSAKSKEAFAEFQISEMKLKSDYVGEAPESLWGKILAILGFPVESVAKVLAGQPWITWGTSLFIFIVYLLVLKNHDIAMNNFGFIPSQWSRYDGLTIFTSFFMHADLFHLLSNLYFFIIFGDDVEDQLGRAKFVFLLVGSHVAGVILHGLFSPHSDIPVVGASAGISGIIGYYAIAFPKRKISYFFIIVFRFVWLRIPAIYAFGFFFLFQMLGAFIQLSGAGEVSYLGHIGGFVIGLIAAVVVRNARRSEQIAQ